MKECFHDEFENLKPVSPEQGSTQLKELHVCSQCGQKVEVSFWRMADEEDSTSEWIPQWHKENSRYKL